ncbi:hypothetical protein Pyn_14238 [Prunus yedoensis var. nudiflora]|uniref:Uncharacterized protein n=1 Tax=Prunus yedoensis var. nudiflora TaxID=2094558 RepID=A0A314YNI1_PRUYE|nr:hypothetical protein Pyn_14238 [Prunus yedoensis var. nudiflora]
MYGGSSKQARVGGGGSGLGAGAAKLGRASFPPRHRSPPQTSRLSLGGGGPQPQKPQLRPRHVSSRGCACRGS